MPEAVRRMEIQKSSGGTPRFEIPTVVDRIAQMAARLVFEPTLEAVFHEDILRISLIFRFESVKQMTVGHLAGLSLRRPALEGSNRFNRVCVNGFDIARSLRQIDEMRPAFPKDRK